MKSKKLPIFLEITKNSFLIITFIMIIYTIVQFLVFFIFTSNYEKDLLIDNYNEVKILSKNVNEDISEEAFYKYLKESTSKEVEEHLRIYSKENLYYEEDSDVWENLDYTYIDYGVVGETKLLDFDLYSLVTGEITIGESKYMIQIVRENDIFTDFIENSLVFLLVTLILGLILSGIGAMYVSKSFVKRLKDLTNTMNEIKENGIRKRAEISELNDEIDKVNKVFNSMMDEVEDAFNEQSRFVSDASHELKTPLTALQGHLKMLKRWGKNDKEILEKSLDTCLSEVDRLKKIVNDMLALSKAEKSEVDISNLEAIRIDTVIEEVVEQYKILNSQIEYNLNIEDNLQLKIDENDLKQLLIIFIDNSIKYNNKESKKISITAKNYSNKVSIQVKDNGIGIPKDEIENVTKRLYKVDKSRVSNNSYGIGLSIAARIISNYNGTYEIDSKVDEFTTIKITL